MNDIFKYCVDLLYYWAALTGLTYEEINVVIFCFMGPIVLIIQTLIIIKLVRQVKFLKEILNQNKSIA